MNTHTQKRKLRAAKIKDMKSIKLANNKYYTKN